MTSEWIEPDEAERERLYLLIEECNEVIHIASKILRFGYEDCYEPAEGTNRNRLTQELGDLMEVIEMMNTEWDIDVIELQHAQKRKRQKLQKFMSRQRLGVGQ